MGLDNGFMLHIKDDEKIEIAYFRKFFELDEWVHMHVKACDNDQTLFEITKADLEKLERDLAPTVLILDKLSMRNVNYYDDNGYPEEYVIEMYGQTFNPADSTSAFAGAKAVRLYHSVVAMLNLFELNPDKDIKLSFYSSW